LALTDPPFLQPKNIAVFGAKDASPESQTSQARLLLAAPTAQHDSGQPVLVDTHTTSTLADLTHTRADLAIIAKHGSEAVKAMEVAGRIKD
jgi:acetyltransferase